MTQNELAQAVSEYEALLGDHDRVV